MARLVGEFQTDVSYGMTDSAAPTAFPKTAVGSLVNGRIRPDGTAQRRPGRIRLSAATLNDDIGYGGVYFRTAAGVDQLVAIFGTQAFYSADLGATWSAACQQGAGINTCVYSSVAHTITTVMDTGVTGTHTWDLTGITGSMTMTPVVTGSPIQTCVSTDNAGTYTAGTIKVTVNGVLYTQAYVTTKDTTLTALAAQLPVAWRSDYYSFAAMRVGTTNYLFAANGDTTIKRWNGTTWDTLPNAPSGVKYVASFNGRLYGTGHSGVLVQGSAEADPTLWASPDGVTLQVPQAPTGMFQIGPHLLVYDLEETSYIDGYGETDIVVAEGAIGFSRSVGCVGFRTIAAVGDNAVCWLSKRGVEYYSPSTGIVLLSNSVRRFLFGLDWTQLYGNPGQMSAAYDAIEQNYQIALSTSGARNNRILCLNLQDQIQYQRPGPKGAASVDILASPSGGDVFFGSDDGYLVAVGVGLQADADADDYMTLATGSGGDSLAADADGYLSIVTNDTLPATLFFAPCASRATTIYSLGYDGFVRRHFDVTTDDAASNGTGGSDVTMSVVSRPFLFGAPEQRKRVRVVHVSVVSADPVDVTIIPRGRGVQGNSHTVSYPGTALLESRRKKVLTHIVADEPQVEVQTTSDAKISLIGADAELLRDSL